MFNFSSQMHSNKMKKYDKSFLGWLFFEAKCIIPTSDNEKLNVLKNLKFYLFY